MWDNGISKTPLSHMPPLTNPSAAKLNGTLNGSCC
jgi:hypothetical protein